MSTCPGFDGHLTFLWFTIAGQCWARCLASMHWLTEKQEVSYYAQEMNGPAFRVYFFDKGPPSITTDFGTNPLLEVCVEPSVGRARDSCDSALAEMVNGLN